MVQATTDSGSSQPLPCWNSMPAWAAMVSLCLSQVMIVWFALAQARRAVRQLHEPSAATTPIVTRVEKIFTYARWTTACLTGIYLFATPLASTVVAWSESTRVLKFFLLPEFLFLAPALLAWVVIWTGAYFVESAVRQRSLPYTLARAQPVHEMPTLGAFMAMQMRHNFYPFIFLLFQGLVRALSAAIAGLISGDDKGNIADFLALGASGISFFMVLPFLLTKIWSTTPLTGPLRQRLDAVAARYKLRFRQILLWRSQNTMINAAIVGWVPRGRYFLMSDALVESFSDQQLESVFAHEVGHGVHRHLHWLIMAVLAAMGIAGGLAAITVKLLPVSLSDADMIGIVLSSILLCFLAAFTIRTISPRFEHQADWFASRHMALMLREGLLLPTPAAPPRTDLTTPITAGMSPLMPPGLASALADAPTQAEHVTREQYLAGHYPHAQASANASPTPAIVEAFTSPEPAATAPPELSASPDRAGAEIFISSLDSIVETSHRDRERRGWFHPSVARRAQLLRELSVDPAAEARFNQSQRRTRHGIIALAGIALLTMAASIIVPENNIPASNTPSTTTAPQSK